MPRKVFLYTLSSCFRISEGGVNCVLLGNIFERQALPLMMSSSGSRETMVKLLARPAKLGGNSTYLSSLKHIPLNKPTCRWGVCRRRGQCRRHQSSKVLADRLTKHHNNTPVIMDEHLENVTNVNSIFVTNLTCPDNDVELTSLYFASLVWMNLAWAPGTSP